MQNQEILAQLIQLNKALSDTILQAEKGSNLLFYKESIKHTALHIFENASLLDTSIQSTKAAPAIKIIKQQETPPPPVVNISEETIKSKIEEVKPVAVLITTEETIKPTTKEVVQPAVLKTSEETIKPTIEEIKPAAVLSTPEETIKPQVSETKKPIIAAPKELEEDDNSLNAKLAKNKIPVQNVADKLTGMPIKELAKAISISKKFELIKELFNNNGDAYKATLENIENSGSYSNALAVIENESLNNPKWTENQELAEEFIGLVKRRFI